MAQFQCRCLRPDRWLWVLKVLLIFRRTTWVGQQRQQLSELQFDRFSNPSSFLVWKTRFETQVSSGSDFPSEAMLLSKEVEMVDSLDGLKILTISIWKRFSTFWDARREVCLGSGQDHQECPVQKRRSASWSRKPKKRSAFCEEDWSPSWSTTTFEWVVLMTQYWIMLIFLSYSSWWQHSGIRREMGRSFIIVVSDDFTWPTSDLIVRLFLLVGIRHRHPCESAVSQDTEESLSSSCIFEVLRSTLSNHFFLLVPASLPHSRATARSCSGPEPQCCRFIVSKSWNISIPDWHTIDMSQAILRLRWTRWHREVSATSSATMYDTSMNAAMSVWIDQVTICSTIFRFRKRLTSDLTTTPRQCKKEIDNSANWADQRSARHVRSWLH